MKLASAYALKAELRSGATALSASADRKTAVASRPQVAIGIARTKQPGEYRIAVRAREKTPATMERIAAITARAAGEVDVRFTGAIRAQPATSLLAAKTLRIGASVAHHRSTAGTLGCFATDAAGNVGFISNNHVLADVDRGASGDAILHPGPADGGLNPDDIVATLFVPFPRLRIGNPVVDCAFAIHTPPTVSFDATDLAGGGTLGSAIVAPEDGLDVEKIGRTTGRTRGVITAFNIDDVFVDYDGGAVSVPFDDQIEIESVDAMPFSGPGDSGSLIFDRSFDPVALLFAGSDSGGTFNSGLTYANPLGTVLSLLHVGLLT